MAARKCGNCSGNDLGEVYVSEYRTVSYGILAKAAMEQYICFDCGEVGGFVKDKNELKEIKDYCTKKGQLMK